MDICTLWRATGIFAPFLCFCFNYPYLVSFQEFNLYNYNFLFSVFIFFSFLIVTHNSHSSRSYSHRPQPFTNTHEINLYFFLLLALKTCLNFSYFYILNSGDKNTHSLIYIRRKKKMKILNRLIITLYLLQFSWNEFFLLRFIGFRLYFDLLTHD